MVRRTHNSVRWMSGWKLKTHGNSNGGAGDFGQEAPSRPASGVPDQPGPLQPGAAGCLSRRVRGPGHPRGDLASPDQSAVPVRHPRGRKTVVRGGCWWRGGFLSGGVWCGLVNFPASLAHTNGL
jgi:hypothetical protein